MIDARRTGDGRVILVLDECTRVLDGEKAELLLRKLATALGLKVEGRGPRVLEVSPGRDYHTVRFIEAGVARTARVPALAVEAYCAAAIELGPGRHEKRAVAERAFDYMLVHGDEELRELVGRLYRGGRFRWEELYGHRDMFYTLFRLPLLVLDSVGVIEFGKSRWVTVKPNPCASSRTKLFCGRVCTR